MPARKRKLHLKRNRLRRNKKSGNKLLVPIFTAVLLALAAFLYIIFTRKEFWSDNAKLSLVIGKPDGSVVITTFDPKLSEITNLHIPANTQVDVAKQLGIWKLGSVWKLGEHEGLDGDLMAATIRYYFKFPVVAWAEGEALGFSETEIGPLIKALFFSYKTNMSLGDRLSLFLFSLRVNNTSRSDIDLAQTQFLKKTKLTDGEEGYIVTRDFSPKLISVFADDVLSSGNYKVSIENATGQQESAEKVGEIMQVLGAKVASISKSDEKEFNCIVTGKEDNVVNMVARVLSCDKLKVNKSASYDIEIMLGKEFLRNF